MAASYWRRIEDLHARSAALDALARLPGALLRLDNEDGILSLVGRRMAAFGPFATPRWFLIRGHEFIGSSLEGPGEQPDQALIAELIELHGGAGEVRVAGQAWAWALPLLTLDGLGGYLVVAAPRAPSDAEWQLLSAVAVVTGVAVAGVLARRRGAEDAAHVLRMAAQLDVMVADSERYGLVYEVLARTVSRADGAEAIAAALHQLTGRSVVVEDARGEQVALAGAEPSRPRSRPTAERLAWRLERSLRDNRPVRDGDLLVVPSAPHGELLGALALVDPDGSATPFESFALEQAAMVLAIELFHQHRIAGVRLSMERDFVDDLLTGLDDESAHSRAQALGRDLTLPMHVLLLRWHNVGGDTLTRAAERAAADTGLRALLTRRDGMVAMIVKIPGPDDGRGPWQELHDRLTAELGSGGSMGVGAVALAPSELPRSFREAGQALSIRALSRVTVGVTCFEDLGVYRILARTESRHDVEQFVHEWLGSLIDYDAAHETNMVGTVAAYCESGGSYDRAAHLLGIHRSTLRYRLRRVRDISHHDVNNVEARFNLEVAARAWRILTGAP